MFKLPQVSSCALCLTLVFAALPLAAADADIVRLDGSKIAVEEIDATALAAMQASHVPGLGIAIFNEGKIVYLRAYGERDTANHAPLTVDSVMTAASLSKAAFAVLVLQLVDRGILDLDRAVYQYLPKPLPQYPAYRDLAQDNRYQQITLRMLLDHTSGFPNWRRFTDDHRLRIYFRPGSRFAYSGEGIDLAQMVVESVTKKSIEQLMRENIFLPLGMLHTSMIWQPRFEKDFANRYDEHSSLLGSQHRKVAEAAGSLQTTLRDYSRFVQAVLNGELLSKQSHVAMLAPQVRITSAHEFPSLSLETSAAKPGIHLSYGLGWGLYWTERGEAFFKEGHDEGWRHYVVCFGRPKSGLLIMTNSSNGEDTYGVLLERLIRDTYTPYQWEGFKVPPRPTS